MRYYAIRAAAVAASFCLPFLFVWYALDFSRTQVTVMTIVGFYLIRWLKLRRKNKGVDMRGGVSKTVQREIWVGLGLGFVLALGFLMC